MQAMSIITDMTVEAISGARTEIMLFLFAICFHWLLFSERSVPSATKRKVKTTLTSPRTRGQPQQKPTQQVTSPRTQQQSANDCALQKLKAAVRESNFEMALKHLQAMPSTVAPLPPQLLQGLVRLASDHRSLSKLLQTMRSIGVAPNLVMLNTFLDSVIAANDIDQAWRCLEEMRSEGLQPNQVTCSILLKGIHASSKPANTNWILSVVESVGEGMDEVLLSSVIEACVRINRADVITRLLERQRTSRGVVVQSPHAYGSLIRAYGFVGNLEGVWTTWREMRQRHVAITSITIGCMVEALCSNGDPEAGYELIRETMADEKMRPLVNAVIYCSVLKGFSHLKRFDRLWTVYHEMKAEDMKFSIVTYNTLVDACARNDQMAHVPNLLQEMVHQGIEPNVITYSAIIKGYCQNRRLDKAFELLADMKRNSNVGPDEHTYNTLLNGCACQGLYERGIGLLEEMQMGGVAPSNFTVSVLVKLCGRARRPVEAFELCQQLSDKYGLKPNVHVYNNLINVCITQRSQMARAMEVLERMIGENVRPDTRTYTLLLRACIDYKDVETAAGLLRAAVGARGSPAGLLQAARGVSSRLQPKDRLPGDFVTEVLDGISQKCSNDALAKQLAQELKR